MASCISRCKDTSFNGSNVVEMWECESLRVVFHNLKGFDGIFIINELYNQQREVTEQLR